MAKKKTPDAKVLAMPDEPPDATGLTPRQQRVLPAAAPKPPAVAAAVHPIRRP